jgi:putative membrane protein
VTDPSSLPAPQPPSLPPPVGLAAARPAPPDAELPGDADTEGWRRLHKVTPVLRGWKVIAVAVAILAQQRGDELLTRGPRVPGRLELLITFGVLVAVVVAAAVYAALSWRMTRYRVDGDVVQLHSGVLFRQQRQARLDRLQAVDVVQPLLGRLFGLSELKLEVAGGAGSDVRLAYLRDDDAEALRNVLLARAAGVAYEGELAPQAPEDELITVPADRLVRSLVRSEGTIVFAVLLVGLVVAAAVARTPQLLVGAAPAVLGLGAALWAQFSRGYGFRVATSPDGIRLRHGLLESRAQTVPPGRVQAVQLTQGLLWRGPDWWRLQINVAGYGGGEGGAQETVLLPVGTRDEAMTLLGLVLPDLGHDDPRSLVAAGMTGAGGEGGFTAAPEQARWLDPVAWRRHGVRATERVLLLRSGRLTRRLVLVPNERTQSLALTQGPLQRRLGLATLTAHSTPGPVSPQVRHLRQDVAAALLHGQAAQARRARAGSGPERWMQPAAPPDAAAAAAAESRVRPGGSGPS